MPSDRLLNTVLGAYQSIHDEDQTNRLLSSTTSLLTTLSNPLNVTLLTSQLLTAPAIWSNNPTLSTSLRIISIFNTAAITVHKHHVDSRKVSRPPKIGGGISPDDWTKAVIRGADDRSERWKHLLVLTGILIGMEGQQRSALSSGLRITIENAVVVAANLSLENNSTNSLLAAESAALAMIHAFPLLSKVVAKNLDCNALAPLLLSSIRGPQGYEDGYFISLIQLDVKNVQGNRLEWAPSFQSFAHLQRLGKKPLVSSMGSLAKLTAYCVEGCYQSTMLLDLLDSLVDFTHNLCSRWRNTKLSEIDATKEDAFLTSDTTKITYPLLWQTLKTAMFAVVVVLRSIMSRSILDPALTTHALAPRIAQKALYILRNLSFVTDRLGTAAFSAHTFVTLTAIDILTHYPSSSQRFLKSILPPATGSIPSHPVDRALDLFYLNTSEHFALSLPTPLCMSLILVPAEPYLSPDAHPSLLPLFEAAHSATLSVLSAPQNVSLHAKTLPTYTTALFASFPQNLSPRQFRYAFKTLVNITASPSLSTNIAQSDMSNILAEFLHYKALNASSQSLPSQQTTTSTDDTPPPEFPIPMSEQAILVMTFIDALPSLPLPQLTDWLMAAAELIHSIPDRDMHELCQRRMWDCLVSGEMDVERAQVAVAWWCNRGGREMVLYGLEDENERRVEEVVMSGGLGVEKSRL